MIRRTALQQLLAVTIACSVTLFSMPVNAAPLPIVDVHIHYSHDSVEMTPPETVIELMRKAGLRHALVSSSDDNGTQLLSRLAPDLIIPGLRPYRRRGELGTWFRDPAALEYVRDLLNKNRYASLGEFHLFGSDADLPIPQEIVKLAAKHNLILHAHSDADAVSRLFAQNPDAKIIWAHSGFDSPSDVADMLKRYPNLWSDLAFRSDMASGDGVDAQWRKVFEAYPNRFMLGTDTFTPERIHFVPEHARESRQWLSALDPELANNIAWRNAENLIVPIWQSNRSKTLAPRSCAQPNDDNNVTIIRGDSYTVKLRRPDIVKVSEAFTLGVTVCRNPASDDALKLDLTAVMPAHGHGMNYQPTIRAINEQASATEFEVSGVLLHMPGKWQWQVSVNSSQGYEKLKADLTIQ